MSTGNAFKEGEKKKLLHALEEEWIMAQVVFQEYEQLFSDQTRIEFLKVVAGDLAGLIQRIFFDDLVVRISRMTDRGQVGRNRNLSFQLIPSFFADDSAKQIQLQASVNAAVNAAEALRVRRNKLIAHRDRDQLLSPHLQGTTIRDIDRALSSVHGVLNAIASFEGAQLDRRIVTEGGARVLIHQTLMLVEATHAVDELIGSASTDDSLQELQALLAKLGYDDPDYHKSVALRRVRAVAKRFPAELIRRLRKGLAAPLPSLAARG